MEVAIVMVALIAYVGFRQWLQHQRRVMVHRERLLAAEKGIEMPAAQQETRKANEERRKVDWLAFTGGVAVGLRDYHEGAARRWLQTAPAEHRRGGRSWCCSTN